MNMELKFPLWQILEEYHLWAADIKSTGIRYGQFFCNFHRLQDTKLFYMHDNDEALEYTSRAYLLEE